MELKTHGGMWGIWL